MKKIITPILLASAILSVATASNAQAQVSGIATADPAIAIARAKALSSGYTQISTTHKGSLDLIDGRQKTVQTLQKQLDTNGDNQLSQQELQTAETNNNPAIAQIRAEQAEMQKLQAPVVLAQMYVLQQVSEQYNTAQNQVIAAKKVNVILSPDALLYAPQGTDITQDIVASLDTLIPAANTNVPQGWQPTRQTAQLHQQIQQLLQRAAIVRANQAAQSAQPATPQPSGR